MYSGYNKFIRYLQNAVLQSMAHLCTVLTVLLEDQELLMLMNSINYLFFYVSCFQCQSNLLFFFLFIFLLLDTVVEVTDSRPFCFSKIDI